MSCCPVWRAGEQGNCRIPTSADPGDGYVWDKLNQAWVKGFVMECQKPWDCTPSNCACGLTKEENRIEVGIERSENEFALKQQVEELSHYLKAANIRIKELEQALAKYDHRDHTV